MTDLRMSPLIALCALAVGVGVAALGGSAEDAEDNVQNERAAVGVVRTLNTALVVYNRTYKTGYALSLGVLGSPRDGETVGPWAANLVDSTVERGVRQGYKFIYRPGPEDSEGRIRAYTVTARPMKYGETGKLSVFTDESGIIRATRENREATAKDPPLQ
jgi:hypothetical protein